ncbi:hypothetical protein NL676_010883 [Syzygium grande]|nr:hypothetical protein NL676_010883 [Syzygium grande]
MGHREAKLPEDECRKAGFILKPMQVEKKKTEPAAAGPSLRGGRLHSRPGRRAALPGRSGQASPGRPYLNLPAGDPRPAQAESPGYSPDLEASRPSALPQVGVQVSDLPGGLS